MTVMTLLSYILIGVVIGWLSRLIYKERGIKMIPSIAFGVIGALIPVIIVYIAGLAGAGFFAAIGAMGILFTINTFRQQKPVFDDVEP